MVQDNEDTEDLDRTYQCSIQPQTMSWGQILVVEAGASSASKGG
jgi:hypothetical protein